MITQGAQQGINFLADLFLDVGDGMAVKAPYIGALEAFAAEALNFTKSKCKMTGYKPGSVGRSLQASPIEDALYRAEFSKSDGHLHVSLQNASVWLRWLHNMTFW